MLFHLCKTEYRSSKTFVQLHVPNCLFTITDFVSIVSIAVEIKLQGKVFHAYFAKR